MKELLRYRENSYFNDKDYFLLLDIGLNKLFLTDVENKNNGWFAKKYLSYSYKRFENNDFSYNFKHNKGCLSYKMTSIPCINIKEIIGLKVRYCDTELTGVISKGVLNNLGIFWDNSLTQKEFKKYGFPYFWNELENLKLF